MSSYKEIDKQARKLIKAADKDCRMHGARSVGDILDTVPLEYFDVLEVAEAYLEMRKHQKTMKEVLKAIQEAGEHIEWYKLDE